MGPFYVARPSQILTIGDSDSTKNTLQYGADLKAVAQYNKALPQNKNRSGFISSIGLDLYY